MSLCIISTIMALAIPRFDKKFYNSEDGEIFRRLLFISCLDFQFLYAIIIVRPRLEEVDNMKLSRKMHNRLVYSFDDSKTEQVVDIMHEYAIAYNTEMKIKVETKRWVRAYHVSDFYNYTYERYKESSPEGEIWDILIEIPIEPDGTTVYVDLFSSILSITVVNGKVHLSSDESIYKEVVDYIENKI